MDSERIILQLQSILKEYPGIELSYLFGSQVEGQTGPMSDIDLGVLIALEQSEMQLLSKLEHAIRITLGIDQIDLVSLRKAPVELAFAIIAKGVCLQQQDLETRVEFEAKVMSRFADYLPVLRAQREDILRGDEHGRREQRYREAFRRTERTLREIKTSQS